MTELNDKAKKVFQLKYSKNKTKNWKDACLKIAEFMTQGEEPYNSLCDLETTTELFYQELVNLRMIPGGRIIANAGTGIKNLANCFVLPVDDSRKSIYSALKDASEVFAMGGGVGYSFSKIREEGAFINSTGGKASGPLSFLTLFDQTGEVIQQASRRGAQLASLDISHPDIEKFIGFKSTLNSRNKRLMEEYDRNLKMVNGELNGTKYERVLEKTLLDDQLTHFNISVLLTDKFMQAVEEDLDWDLVSPKTNEVVKTVKAKDLLYKMAKQAWESGDPGELFYDRINRDNLVPYIGNITSTNPCLHPDTLIETINGRIPIKDIKEDTYVYSVDLNGKLVIKKASASWISKRNAETLILKLNNGRELCLTPDHKVLTKKRGWIEAKDLHISEEVVSLCRARRGAKYSGIKLSTDSNREYRMEHRFIYEFINGVINNLDYDVHHIDDNSYNNKIENLKLLSHSEHCTLTRKNSPNNHQVWGENGRFTSNNNNYKKPIIQMPYDLRSDFPGQPRIVSIGRGETVDVYDIQVEDTHNLIANYVVVHNCGEVPLLEGESCILTSINLYLFYDVVSKSIDLGALKNTVKIATRFLEDVTEITEAPVEYINTITKNLRRLGLGVMGLADLLVALNIPYESEEAVELSEFLSWFISYHAWITSYELAKERGAFGYYDKDKVNFDVVYRTLYDNPYETFEVPFEELKKVGLRNVSITSLAPTGSIAIIGGVNSGIEPFFALAYKRNITEGVGNIATDSMFEINPALENKLKEFGYTQEQILEIVDCSVRTGSLQNCDVTDELKQLFKTANEISWEYHIKIQSAWQKYTSNAISKTINIPEEATIEDIFNIYVEMWKADLKGGTVYRN